MVKRAKEIKISGNIELIVLTKALIKKGVLTNADVENEKPKK